MHVLVCNQNRYLNFNSTHYAPQFFSDQLSLYQLWGGADYAHYITTSPPPPRFLDLPTALLRHPPTSF